MEISNPVQFLYIILAQAVVLARSSISPPIITSHPIDIEVVRNEPVTLDCRASGSPQPAIEWYRLTKDGQVELVPITSMDPSSHRILLPDGSLFFLSAKEGRKERDSGIYWCVASNEAGVARSQNATLSIAYMTTEFRLTPADSDVTKGKDLVLKCSPPKGSPAPVITWKKNGETIGVSSSSRITIDEVGNLVIQNASLEDRGRYQCAAENLAALRISSPAIVRVNELPQIVTKPSDTSVQVGDSALIMCQAEGRPHPDIEWIKISGAPIDLNRVRVVNGKGIRIERVELKDEGEYLCKAKNVAGSEEAKASLVITQRPFFKIKPSNRVQIPANSGKMVALECQSGGQPSPTSFWVREGQRTLIHPLSTDSGALFLSNPSLEDGGHFACIALNEVGSAMTRAQVIVYDPNNANQPKEDAIDLVEARRRFDSLQLTLTTAKALDQNSIKISWSLNDQGLNIFLSGFRVFYRKIGDVHFEMVEISHPQASSFVISRLEEYTEYQIFIMPFYQDTFGMPSRLALVQTHPHIPSSAPTITKAMVLNETTIFLAWQPLNEAAANGLLTAYEIRIEGNATMVNNSVLPSVTEVSLHVTGMSPELVYSISIAAVNAVGQGPFSVPVRVQLADLHLANILDGPLYARVTQVSLIIAIVSSVIFVLAMMGVVAILRRKRGLTSDLKHRRSPLNYLHSTSADEIDYPHLARQTTAQDFWISQCSHLEEEESNSSEKKLLTHSNSTSNSESEYTYVGSSLLKKKSVSGAYASTDILRNCETKSSHYLQPHSHYHQHHSQPRGHHYSRPLLHRGNTDGGRRRPNLLDILPPPPTCAPPPPQPHPGVTYVVSNPDQDLANELQCFREAVTEFSRGRDRDVLVGSSEEEEEEVLSCSQADLEENSSIEHQR